ncbi:MAG TPA: ThuA domain-containing protein [Candidatus Paceibacterota bacterium]|nr:ThuA domain-containing protein [Verrucomicrobiota bacterium]HSA12855.1 ThuA domain-containing protein [Candidatus Paceibacterota bacterium]
MNRLLANLRRAQLAGAFLGCCWLPCVSPGAEPWADDRLTVRDGLEFWCDSSRQKAGRAALGLPPPAAGGGVDCLLDGSGHNRHLAQPLVNARPRLVQDADAASLAFDGNDDALVSSSLRGEAPETTVFIVAAPRSNPGGFRALLSVSRAGRNDYETGLNLDFGPQATPQMSFINAEGSGALRATQLLRNGALPFGGWHVFSLESKPGGQGIRLALNGKPEGSRERRESKVAFHQLVLGGRHYSLSGEPPYIQGFFHGNIAEVLLYSRLLTPAEKSSVEQYLSQKHAPLLRRSPQATADTLEPSVLEIPGDPPPRKRAEVEAVLKSADVSGGGTEPSAAPFEVVLCAGPKDHGPCEHDYPLWQTRWAALLGSSRNVQVGTAWEWPSPKQWQTARVIVFYSNNPGWNTARGAELDAYLERGGGLLFIHYAVDGHHDVEALAKRIGYAWRGGFSKFRHGPLDLKCVESPLTAGFSSVHFVDESYWNLVGDGDGVRLVASGQEEGKMQPLIWTRTQGKGRVCVNILGHYTWTFDDPLFRILLLRGICWAGGEPVDRLSHLALPGARLAD